MCKPKNFKGDLWKNEVNVRDFIKNNYKEYTDKAPLFGHNDVVYLRNFIKRYIEKGLE